MTDPVEVMARAISGAPFPSVRSKAKARAALSALDAAGFAVVPKEPTEAMEDAGEAVTINCIPSDTPDASIIYRAMLSAAQVKP